MKGNLSISKETSNLILEDKVCITLKCTDRIIRLRLSLKDYALVLTGKSEVPGELSEILISDNNV